MADFSVDEIVQKALTLEILTQNQLQDIWTSFGTRNIDGDAFIQALLRQGQLTKYQVDRLVAGETTGFYYGDYKVLYPVGAGTFARVYRTVNVKTGKVAAVKVLRNRFSSDQEAVDLFVREAELGMQLRHPNIVGVYEVNSYQNAHYMVMDFIEGQTLRNYMNAHKKVEYKIATRITTDICQGLDYAFKRGHLHRDLKPTNALLSSAGRTVLLDFGLAADTDESDQKNQRAIDYAALERSTGVRRDDKRSDIYFLGTMFYQMLTGVAPLGEIKERAKRLNKSRFLGVKPISEFDRSVPYVLAFIVEKAMQLDPEKRYQSPGAMLVDLEVAVKKLEEGGGTADEVRGNRIASPSSMSLVNAAKKNSDVATVSVIEADPNMQNVFRESLKRAGYRVLVFSTVERAIERFQDPDANVACVLFNAQSLGKMAVLGFNQLARTPLTEEIPAILLLDENQVKWAAKAERARHRVAVGMPITMKRLQEVIRKLLSDRKLLKEKKEEAVKAEKKAVQEKVATTGNGANGNGSVEKRDVGNGVGKETTSGPTVSGSLPDGMEGKDVEVGPSPQPAPSPETDGSEESVKVGDAPEVVEGGADAGLEGLGQEVDSDLFDDAIDGALDSMIEKLQGNVTEVSEPKPVTESPNPPAQEPVLEDDEDDSDDYIEDEDL